MCVVLAATSKCIQRHMHVINGRCCVQHWSQALVTCLCVWHVDRRGCVHHKATTSLQCAALFLEKSTYDQKQSMWGATYSLSRWHLEIVFSWKLCGDRILIGALKQTLPQIYLWSTIKLLAALASSGSCAAYGAWECFLSTINLQAAYGQNFYRFDAGSSVLAVHCGFCNLSCTWRCLPVFQTWKNN